MSKSSTAAAAAATSAPKCQIDTRILDKKSLADMQDIGLSFFAATCGKNRGAFVLDPPDGQTYGCLNLPESFPEMAGITHLPEGVVINDANAIKDQYVGGNVTATGTLNLLDLLVQSAYQSSPDKATTIYACEFNGLAELTCGQESTSPQRSPRSDGTPIRSVTLAGLFVDALWATNGKPLTVTEMSEWYTAQDFEDMATLGLTTVQIRVPTAAFTPDDEYGAEVMSILEDFLLPSIGDAGLDAIITLVATGDELDAVVAAAEFASGEPTILALTLPSGTKLDTMVVLDAIRALSPTLNVMVPFTMTDLVSTKVAFDKHVFGSLTLSHTTSVADIASSSSREDRSKLFYHEATSCMTRSPLEFSACFQALPVFVSDGFDISIDDCATMDTDLFKDYGQCGRFEETVHSEWWADHRKSLAARQVYAYERGLGWSFAAWKVQGDNTLSDGVLDTPAKLLSFQAVSKAGLLPDLTSSEAIIARYACLNPPANDFVLGDDTLAPTMGPAPDCGNGWWNATTVKCDYWIPPPPPTPAPTVACLICEDCPAANVLSTSGAMGAVIGLIVGAVVTKFACSNNRRSDYDPIPN